MREEKYIGLQKTLNQIEASNLWWDRTINFYNYGKTILIVVLPYWFVFPYLNDWYSIIFEAIWIIVVWMLWIPLYHSFPIIRKEIIVSDLTWVLYSQQVLISNIKNLKKLIKEDEKKFGVSPEFLMNIKQMIQTTSAASNQYLLWINIIRKQRKYLFYFRHPFSYFYLINSLIRNEKSELISLMNNFTVLIQEWTTLHQKELLEIEQELEKQALTTENLSGQWAIDLQRVRLHEHIENLEKMRVQI